MTHDEQVKAAIEMRNSQLGDLISRLEESEADEVERLKAKLGTSWQESDDLNTEIVDLDAGVMRLRRQFAELEAELERLKAAEEGYGEIVSDLAGQIKSHEAHTWQQERAAVVAWLLLQAQNSTWGGTTLQLLVPRIEAGEHWPPTSK